MRPAGTTNSAEKRRWRYAWYYFRIRNAVLLRLGPCARLAGRLAGWLAGWLAGRLAGWLAGS